MGRVSNPPGRKRQFTARPHQVARAGSLRAQAGAPVGELIVRFLPRVRKDVRAEVERLAAAIRRECPPAHRVEVTVVPHYAVKGEGGGYGFAAFGHPPRKPRPDDVPLIGVAGGAADIGVKRFGESRAEAVCEVGKSFLHEWVHYEQWRATGTCTERGVAVRTRNLYARLSGGADAKAG